MALPTVDVYSDVALTTKLYVYGQAKWAGLLLGPLLLNYALSWYAWFTYEKRKKTTWIAALVGFYPQFVCIRVIWLMWTCPKKGKQGKENFERNLMEHEVFTEAIPTSFIMTFLMFFLNLASLNCKCREWSEEVPSRVHLFHISSSHHHFRFPNYNNCHH